MRFVITSDWHADAMTAGFERFGDVSDAASIMVSAAIVQNVDAFMFLGDLSDPDPPRCWRAASLAIQSAVRLADYGIPSIWITGNHDVLEDGVGSHTLQPLKASGLARVVDYPEIVSLTPKCEVLALPFVARSRRYDPIEIVSRHSGATPTLVIGHLNIEGISPGSESIEFARGRDVFLPVAEIRSVFPHAQIVNGHYHAAQTYNGVHVPGSLVRLTRDEAGNAPGYLLIEV